jgi:hypothetical protein
MCSKLQQSKPYALLAVLVVAVYPLLAGGQQPASSSFGVGKYNGPGACTASNCHGGVQPKDLTRIPQNEYSIWSAQDKHARAYLVLSNPVSLRMGRILGIEQPNKAAKCLQCHALFVSPELRATTFQLDDGVSCENCHGPAVGWLGPHTTKDWKHEQSIELRMYDTRDLVSRSQKCLSCHLGTTEKQVDHEMIAAGHPDLTFELNSFSAAMPRHWKPNPENLPFYDVQELAIGQAVQLRESLNRLSRRALSQQWPEFAEMDCFACHHSLGKPEESWRQAVGYNGRKPGAPNWDMSRYVVFSSFAQAADPHGTQSLQEQINKIAALVGKWASPQDISASAAGAAGMVDPILQKLRTQKYTQSSATQIMVAITENNNAIAARDERSAEQVAMALDSLAIANAKSGNTINEKELRAAISKLFQQLENPSSYNAQTFANQMRKIRALLPVTTSGMVPASDWN